MVTTGGRDVQRFGRVRVAAETDLDVGFGDALDLVAELRHQQFGGIGVDGLVDRRHHAHAHQRLDDVAAALGHAVGEFLHRDVLGHHHVAHHFERLGRLQQRALFFALARAAHRGEAARALVVVGERAGDGDLAGVAPAMLQRVAARRRGGALDVGARDRGAAILPRVRARP